MAECHPVGFQWVMEAKARGATVIHVDPRFTRTSAVADLYVPLRAGSDIAFLGGIDQLRPRDERDFRDYVVAYTNAPTIVDRGLPGHRGSRRAVLRLRPREPQLRLRRPGSTRARRSAASGARAASLTPMAAGCGRCARRRAARRTARAVRPPIPRRHRRPCSIRAACSRSSSGTTPATRRRWSSRSAACPQDLFAKVCELVAANSGRERTTAFVYAVGWTQHTVGVQYIRTAAILQLLLGNIGRPGGGILALRGHASIQGSTDIPTLFNMLPGYLPMPHAHGTEDLDDLRRRTESAARGFWGNMRRRTWSAC